ncbi:WXG100 family type VII secretion target [Streptomyces longispororuber]|uniref:WXG100 family type VII secretion target n=1 Tax=Streptomyces longispororuber TaxID=68230 RepID=UPI0021098B02|nr:WXG100 family type VII secretion target [Streptomyces longispororuber]MCQ4213889.1 WXG100 family type VII secretion target [Streptomyces longispororuber]
MAGGRQKLEDQQVVVLEKQMSEKYDGIRKRVHNLQGVIDSLEGQWQGIGKNAFDKKQFEINESLQNIGKILADVIDSMNKTRNIKDSSEDDVRASVDKISVTDGASSLRSY